MQTKADLGRYGEEKAVHYLMSGGYEILCRNFRCKAGEIDIVARDRTKSSLIVFFEVKTRRSCIFGLPCESVTVSKLRKIKRVIREYVDANKHWNCDFRIDVIEVFVMNQKTYLRHLENIF